uniref:PHP C-terminal domain protein n=1 Tax=Solibacter usitatus (strain Ellin6076) TaxID=234267 RepID=Q01R88_SOLUE
MGTRDAKLSAAAPSSALSNAQIADKLAGLAQLLSTNKENPYKVKAYRRAAAKIRSISESLDELVREDADLTSFSGIGDAIASAIREIVLTGTLRKLDTLRGQAAPEVANLADYPRLDPKRVLRTYKKLKISSIEELREKLESGAIAAALGQRMAQHVRQGLSEAHAILLYHADDLQGAIEGFLIGKCGVAAVQVVGACRRRVEVVHEIAFVIQTGDFPAVVRKVERYGGQTPLFESSRDLARFALSSGIELRLRRAKAGNWGLCLIAETGSEAHLRKLELVTGKLTAISAKGPFPTEAAFYSAFEMSYIEPELREGHDEIARALQGTLPKLVTAADIRGELHAHSTSSDGVHSIEQMAIAARERGYEYIGISDHSQSLKIAKGVSIEDLWAQIKYIDRLNEKLKSVRILKSSEVDILADGTLDYPDDLLRALDYTVCSVHSRFGLNREQQTERIMRAMDNRYFNILGHATGRLLLKRPGYEVDMTRIIAHAKATDCLFEINSSPDRLDLSAEHARMANQAGVKIAVTTDAHSTREFGTVQHGIDQARRAGLEPASVLNCLPWASLQPLFRR